MKLFSSLFALGLLISSAVAQQQLGPKQSDAEGGPGDLPTTLSPSGIASTNSVPSFIQSALSTTTSGSTSASQTTSDAATTATSAGADATSSTATDAAVPTGQGRFLAPVVGIAAAVALL